MDELIYSAFRESTTLAIIVAIVDRFAPVVKSLLVRKSVEARWLIQPTTSQIRQWLVRWLTFVSLMQIAVGFALPWIANTELFAGYHHSLETAFWGDAAPAAARVQQS
jgi:hypothetical protein